VLRPGGVLFTTNRVGWEAKLLPGKALSSKRLQAILDELPLQAVEVRRWQVFYDQVWARKAGSPSAEGNGDLDWADVLLCPYCADGRLKRAGASVQCPTCHRVYCIEDGIFSLTDDCVSESSL
jgi:uncharacterized protein YbaR (Trm112 family)